MFSKETLEEAREELCEPITDGGLPRYLTEDLSDEEWKHYGSRVVVTVMGTTLERVDDDRVAGRSRAQDVEIRDAAKKQMEWTERLEANIINSEAWLHGHWLETVEFPEEIELDENRIFLPDLGTAEVAIDFHMEEVIKAARQRATEDFNHYLYVLGNWTYLAEKHDHVAERTGHKLHRAFERAKQNDPNAPSDATCEEYGGGQYGD